MRSKLILTSKNKMTQLEILKLQIEKRIKSIEDFPFCISELGWRERQDGKLAAYKEVVDLINSVQSQSKPTLSDVIPKDQESQYINKGEKLT